MVQFLDILMVPYITFPASCYIDHRLFMVHKLKTANLMTTCTCDSNHMFVILTHFMIVIFNLVSTITHRWTSEDIFDGTTPPNKVMASSHHVTLVDKNGLRSDVTKPFLKNNVNLPLMRFSTIYSYVMFTLILKSSIPNLCFKLTHLKSWPHFLTWQYVNWKVDGIESLFSLTEIMQFLKFSYTWH